MLVRRETSPIRSGALDNPISPRAGRPLRLLPAPTRPPQRRTCGNSPLEHPNPSLADFLQFLMPQFAITPQKEADSLRSALFVILCHVLPSLARIPHQAVLCAATAAERTENMAAATSAAAPEPVSDNQPAPSVNHATNPTSPKGAALAAKLPKAKQQRQIHRTQRMARYHYVRKLSLAGMSQRAIARQLAMTIHTVHIFVKADGEAGAKRHQFPERATRRPMASKLDPFLPYLRQRLAAGEDNAMQLWRDLRDQHGYPGLRALVSRWVAQHRYLNPKTPFATPKPKRPGKPPTIRGDKPVHAKQILSARQAAWPFELTCAEGLVDFCCRDHRCIRLRGCQRSASVACEAKRSKSAARGC